MALVTGGSPKTVGAFYDVAYDRVLAPPKTTTGNGLAGGNCTDGSESTERRPNMKKASKSTRPWSMAAVLMPRSTAA